MTMNVNKPRTHAHRRATRLLLFLVAALLSVVAVPSPADAQIQETAHSSDGLVNNNVCSLSEAITNANDNQPTWSDCPYTTPTRGGLAPDVILLEPTTVYQYTTGHNATDSALPLITDDLIIRSAVRGDTAVIERAPGATDLFRLLEVSGDVDLTLQDITIRGGDIPTGLGGGIKFFNTVLPHHGSLTLRSTIIEENSALLGGGVFASGIRSLVIFDSSILDNGADIHAGGAFVQADQASLSRAIVQRNVTAGRGGGVFALVPDDAVFSVLGSRFERNSSNQIGGGLFVDSSNFSGSQTLLIKSEFSLNQAAQGGGGIYTRPGGGTIRVQNVTVSANRTALPVAGTPATAGLVIDSAVSPTVQVHHVTITDNIGGGLGPNGIAAAGFWANSPNVTLRGSLIADNHLSGGAAPGSPLDVDLTNMKVSNSLFGHSAVTTLESVGSAGVPPGNTNGSSDGDALDLADMIGPLTPGPATPVVTWSHPLLPGSPLIDAAGACLPYGVHADQHFESRRTGRCDIGAFEFQ